MNIKWCQCPKCLGNAVDDGMDGIRCRRCGNLSIDECIEYAKTHLTPAAPDRGCRHAHSNYQVNPDDCSVWCFSCKPPRQVS